MTLREEVERLVKKWRRRANKEADHKLFLQMHSLADELADILKETEGDDD